MFVPRMYQVDDDCWPFRVIHQYPLATLVSNGPIFPYATHVPVLVPPESADRKQLAGTTLVAHMNCSNPHWDALSDGTAAKMIFQGPAGYVTPAVYRTDPAAPTWDFITVHLQGVIRIVSDQEEVLRIVTATARALEERFGAEWDLESSLGYFRSIVSGVGAFHFMVESVDAMFKLSQEKDPEVQERVIDWFSGHGRSLQAELADTMREYGLGDRRASSQAT
jgi:transcriptional regulator